MIMAVTELNEKGITGPFELADNSLVDPCTEVALALQDFIKHNNRVAQLAGKPRSFGAKVDRHSEFEAMQQLFADANVQATVAEHFGKELFLYNSVFQIKREGVGENIWHHDRIFENGGAPVDLHNTDNHFSILFALTDLGWDQGRLEYVRGSHQPVEDLDRTQRFHKTLPACLDDRIDALTLKKGEFAVFHSSLMHRSLPFESGDLRVSLAVRLARNGTVVPEMFPTDRVQGDGSYGFAKLNPSAVIQFN
jgi:ectoine hydroxylase-related dioxygenase (phytanoyl-CoA dioxygenase family)